MANELNEQCRTALLRPAVNTVNSVNGINWSNLEQLRFHGGLQDCVKKWKMQEMALEITQF